jgi:signal transduction histidine kinase
MMKVLVVDGSKEQRQEIVEALARLDRVCVQGAVADARTALRVLAHDAPDIMVTSTHLADGAGLDLIEAARRAPHAPAIVVVGGDVSSREEWRRHLKAGAARFVDHDRGMVELREVVTALASDLHSDSDDQLRLLGRLTAGVVHDLNNYLALIGGTVTLLQRNPGDPVLIAQLRRGLSLATRLTGSLQSYARGETPPFEAIDLGALVRSTIDLARSSISETIDVIDEVEPDLAPVRGIRAELEQLVLNIVLNAADAMPSGGELRVRVAGTEATTVLEIADTGDGITVPGAPDDVLTRSTKGSRRGGLGLGIVRRVAARHGATLRFAHALPSGTVVTVVFSSHH